jgi:mannose-1-phosphate guanylyltransferase
MISRDDRPKQFCRILPEETLLETTLNRVSLKIDWENTFYSLTAKHEFYSRPLLAKINNSNLIVQPVNAETAPAILYSLLRLFLINPQAAVAFFPSDHYFLDGTAFMESVHEAFRTVEHHPENIILLGVEPEKAETSYGWIEPAESHLSGTPKSVSKVAFFWEKPPVDAAQAIMARGCLWNSFVMIGKARSFLQMIEEALPELYKLFNSTTCAIGMPLEPAMIRFLYTCVDEIIFSSAVLEKSVNRLLVMKVQGVAWSDWGTRAQIAVHYAEQSGQKVACFIRHL